MSRRFCPTGLPLAAGSALFYSLKMPVGVSGAFRGSSSASC